MNISSSTITEQLEDERSLTDSLMNELLLLRQKLNVTSYTEEPSESDRIHEVDKKLDALGMRILRIERRSIPRDWNLYKIIWRLDQFTDVLKNAEKYERSLFHVRAPYCDPNSLKDVCSPISSPNLLVMLSTYEPTFLDLILLKVNTCQCAWPCVLGLMMGFSLYPFKVLLKDASLVKKTYPTCTNNLL